jgi:DNA polymerase-3 subunit epsilon
MMMALAENHTRVAFNTTFDNRIIRIALKRFFSNETADAWKAGSYECAMAAARKVMGGKQPKLVDAYKYFTGLELVGAHNAMADTLAARDVFFACMATEPKKKEEPVVEPSSEGASIGAPAAGFDGF